MVVAKGEMVLTGSTAGQVALTLSTVELQKWHYQRFSSLLICFSLQQIKTYNHFTMNTVSLVFPFGEGLEFN